MGVQMDETNYISSSDYANPESISQTAIMLISIGSLLVMLCAATVIYSLRRRKIVARAFSPATESLRSPTDFMNSLATWDGCQSLDDVLEKKRRSVWTLDVFDDLKSNGIKVNVKT